MKLGMIVGGSVVASLAAGLAAGYYIASRLLEDKYAKISEKEIKDAKEFYKRLHKREEFATPEQAFKSLIGEKPNDFEPTPGVEPATEAMRLYQGRVIPDPRVMEVKTNVFEQGVPITDISEEEMRNRTEEAPYVISVDEYMENEEGYTQVDLVYYQGDGVLADGRDDIIENVDETIGLDNLKKFGRGSKDSRIVYVRNHVREVDFEIALHDGSYKELVAGFVGDDG